MPPKNVLKKSENGLSPPPPPNISAISSSLLLRIAQDLVGLVDFLEPGLGAFVTGIHIRVVLARELPEGLLDLLVRRRLRDAKRGVVVLEVHDATHRPHRRRDRVTPPDDPFRASTCGVSRHAGAPPAPSAAGSAASLPRRTAAAAPRPDSLQTHPRAA